MKKLNKKGQSTMEYVIVLTAIVAAIIFAAVTFIKPAMNSIYNETGTTLTKAGAGLSASFNGKFAT